MMFADYFHKFTPIFNDFKLKIGQNRPKIVKNRKIVIFDDFWTILTNFQLKIKKYKCNLVKIIGKHQF